MSGTSVKICGLQNAVVLKAIMHLPIDYIGLVFAESRRRVSPAQAADIIGCLRQMRAKGEKPLAVGVFVNPSQAELDDVMSQAPLDIIQLHGQESPDDCSRIKQRFMIPVFKVFWVNSSLTPDGADPVETILTPYRGSIDAIMLDTFEQAAGGGTGKIFNWERIPDYRRVADKFGIPLIVAGGLEPGNVSELIARYRPQTVDVSSGVETGGVKDIEKITAFVERVKGE